MTTNTPTSTEHASRREALECEFLRRLFMRDAEIWRERCEARDSIVSNSQVRRTNPHIEKAPREALSPYDADNTYSLGRTI
jgi:hypothetical protein